MGVINYIGRGLLGALLVLGIMIAPSTVFAATADISGLASSTHTVSIESSSRSVTFSWTAATDDAFAGFSFLINTSSSGTPDTSVELPDTSATGVTVTMSPDSDTWYFHIREIGSDGTPGATASLGPFKIDTTSPGQVTSASATAGSASVTLAWTPPSTDFSSTEIRYNSITSGDCSYPTSTSDTALTGVSSTAGTASTKSHTGLTDGTTYCYSIFAKDTAGNYSTAVQVSTTPSSSGFTGAISIAGGNQYTTSASVSVTLQGTHSSLTVDAMQFSDDDSTWVNTSGTTDGIDAYGTSVSYTLAGSSTEGTKTLYVRYIADCSPSASIGPTTTISSCDSGKTTSSSYSDTIILDTTAPTSPTISGASDGTSASVVLTLSATNADFMEIAQSTTSGEASFPTTNSTGYISYGTSNTYTMNPSTDGTYHVYVRYKDETGNVSSFAEVTITCASSVCVGSGAAIPTVGEYGMMILITLMIGYALVRKRYPDMQI